MTEELVPTRPFDYAPAPESQEIVTIEERYGLFVGGRWLEPSETYTTINPATEEPLAVIAQAGAAEVDLAVRAARTAFEDSWSALRPAAVPRSVRGERSPARNGPSTCSGSRGSCRSARASSPCSSR